MTAGNTPLNARAHTSTMSHLYPSHGPWIWAGQDESRENWPSIVTQTGTTIHIPPRRYVIKLKLLTNRHPLDSTDLQSLKELITPTHSYKYAPEPLKTIDSILQILTEKEPDRNTIYIYLTNISSQIMRRTLFEGLLEKLQNKYKPELTIVQMNTSDNKYRTYDTKTMQNVIDATTKRESETGELLWMGTAPQPPWKWRAPILLSHVATGRDEALMPQRATKPRQEADKGKQAQGKGALLANVFKKRKQTVQAREMSPTPSEEEALNQMMDNVEKDLAPTKKRQKQELTQAGPIQQKPITHSSSTNVIRDQNGEIIGEIHPHSSHTTTGTTTTSSTATTSQEATSLDSETESWRTLEQHLQGIQNVLPHTPRLNFFETSYYIASAKATAASIHLELKSERQ